MMTYNIELTREESRSLSIEIGFLIDEYTKRADNAHEAKSETEEYWRRAADNIKPVLEKINSALCASWPNRWPVL